MDAEHDAVRHVFAVVLHRLRSDAGLSLRALAVRARYDYSRLSRAERGEHLPAAAWVDDIDVALNAGGLLVMLRSLIPNGAVAKPGPSAPPRTGLRTDDGDSVTLQMRTRAGDRCI